jgi:1-deoxy-D-xylulose-5-phosphate reductoisomerase
MNAANEIAVEAFIEGRLNFTGIGRTIEATLAGLRPRQLESIGDIVDEDRRARERARRMIKKRI